MVDAVVGVAVLWVGVEHAPAAASLVVAEVVPGAVPPAGSPVDPVAVPVLAPVELPVVDELVVPEPVALADVVPPGFSVAPLLVVEAWLVVQVVVWEAVHAAGGGGVQLEVASAGRADTVAATSLGE